MITDFNITKDPEAVERLCENLETEIMMPLNEQGMKLLITIATSNPEKIAEIYTGVKEKRWII
jgi:inosine-uridine nucleoside N-ribohydrolase